VTHYPTGLLVYYYYYYYYYYHYHYHYHYYYRLILLTDSPDSSEARSSNGDIRAELDPERIVMRCEDWWGAVAAVTIDETGVLIRSISQLRTSHAVIL